MFVAKSKFPVNDPLEMKVHSFCRENESCDFGQKLTFPIMKANWEKKSSCVMSQAVPADLSWNQARCLPFLSQFKGW